MTKRRDILEPLIKKELHSDIKLAFPDKPPIFGAAMRCLKLFSEGFDAEKVNDRFLR